MMNEEDYIEPGFSKRLKKNPFKTPENYFDTIEDRVMNSIEYEKVKNRASSTRKLYHLVKPVLALAASFALVYLLVYHPISFLLQKEKAQSASVETISEDSMDALSLTLSMMDENSLISTIIDEETSAAEQINADEVIAYLSSDMNDLEIYSELQN